MYIIAYVRSTHIQ